MAHKRETMLEALRQSIVAAATSCGSRVYRGRVMPVEVAEFPACLVYHDDESSELNDTNSLKLRLLEVFVDIHAQDIPTTINDPTIETVLNNLAAEIENVIEVDTQIGGNALMIIHQGSRPVYEEGETDRGVMRLDFIVTYRTQRTDAAL